MIRGLRFEALHAAVTVAALCAATACFAQPLPAGVDACLARIEQQRAAQPSEEPADDAGDATGPARLGEACPELVDALNESAWGSALGDTSAEDLSTNAFDELARLVASYERPAPAPQPVSEESLDDVLAALEIREPDTQPSLWERIQKWFDEQFGSQESQTGKWIEDWLNNLSVPERFVRYVLITLGAVLVIVTAAIVVNELRIAGVLAGGALRKYSPLAAREADGEARVRDFDDIARAPLARRPALLLLLVLDRLRARATVPLRDSLTHRELVAAADDLSAEQSDALRSVAGAAERATFGGWRPEEREFDDVVARGRTLVASLAAEPSEPR